MNAYDAIIIGAGPAGLTAGIYAVRSGLKTLILEKGMPGGKANDAPLVENYPCFESISGRELMNKMEAHASRYADIKLENVLSMELKEKVVVAAKEEYVADAVILATGAFHKKLGVPGEEEFAGRGVSQCVICDGFFFKKKHVLVVGGGNTAVLNAIYLKNIGCDVTLIHRRNRLRADSHLQSELFKLGIRVLWNSVVKEIRGGDFVKSVAVHNIKDDALDELNVEGVFVSVGESPNNELAKSIGVKLDGRGYIITDKNQRTNVPRVYAAGDVTGGAKQIVMACAEGATAALSAYMDLKSPYWAD
ncbi:MAG: thioredoxin-disulfide reductase [Methanosarcinales archaeon Met12]|nr:MAG: thioredoxin-disulfide reductase [Methanosarcinales archaeon Met12]